MLPWNRTSTQLLGSVILALSLSMATAQVIDPLPQVYTISPNTAVAGNGFTMYLLGGNFGCSTVFSRESVTVTEKRIDLSFVANATQIATPLDPKHNTPAASTAASDIACLANADTTSGTKLLPVYTPTFSIPGLKAGTYEVWATQMYECLYTQPSCKIAVQPKYAGTLTVTGEGTITYTINPTETAADVAFSLDLLSYQFTCANTFDMLASSVSGNTISLTFLDHVKVGIMCPAIYKPYGPTYKMAPLKAGTYSVKAYRLPACAAQGCPMATTGVDAGTLVVKGAATREGWFLKPREVAPDLPFTMNLLNNAVGNCGTTFSHQSVRFQNGEIWVSFLTEMNPNIECFANITPYGPSFPMDAMKPGMYPVRVTQLLPCQVTAPFCPIATIIPPISDTLTVSKTTSIRIPGAGATITSPTAYFQGQRLNLSLPGVQALSSREAGTWNAELLTPAGRVLAVYQVKGVDARAGGLAGFDAGSRIERGLYLLRLHSPSGETQTLPVARRE